jgi:WD repeat and SOF domain-containing protein 1
MPGSLHFPPSPRNNGLRQKPRHDNLPTFSSALDEKLYQHAHIPPWAIPIALSIPGTRNIRLRFLLPHPGRIHQLAVSRFGRKRGSLILCFAFLALIFSVFALAKRFGTRTKQWPTPFPPEPPTLVFRREDLQRIWKWEVASGHYPSRQASKLLLDIIQRRVKHHNSSIANWLDFFANESRATRWEASFYSFTMETTSG